MLPEQQPVRGRDRGEHGHQMGQMFAAAPVALYHVLDAMVRILAPLIPYTAEEVYAHLPGAKVDSVHLLTLVEAHPDWADEKLLARWERLLEIRGDAIAALTMYMKPLALPVFADFGLPPLLQTS